jgi:hypothetical protein
MPVYRPLPQSVPDWLGGFAFRAAFSRLMRSRRTRHLSSNRRIADFRCTGHSGPIGGVSVAGLPPESRPMLRPPRVGTRHKPRWLHLDVVEGHDADPAFSCGPMVSTPGFL